VLSTVEKCTTGDASPPVAPVDKVGVTTEAKPTPSAAKVATPAAPQQSAPTPPKGADTESRYGIDDVFPLMSYYQQEIWPKTYAETGAK